MPLTRGTSIFDWSFLVHLIVTDNSSKATTCLFPSPLLEPKIKLSIKAVKMYESVTTLSGKQTCKPSFLALTSYGKGATLLSPFPKTEKKTSFWKEWKSLFMNY